MTCGLNMRYSLPIRFPKGYAAKYKGRPGAAIRALEHETIIKAIEAWNKRKA